MKKIIKVILKPLSVFIRKITSLFGSFYFTFCLNLRRRKRVYLIGTPSHNNIGDSAIALAELLFLKKHGYKPFEITCSEYRKHEAKIIKRTTDGVVFLHGGGNMGNQWLNEELLRRRIIDNNSPKCFIVFPQTFFYTNDENGKKSMAESKHFYQGEKRVLIAARERKSFLLMKQSYPNARIVLVPDIVLFIKDCLTIRKLPRKHVMTVFRNDIEKSINAANVNYIKKCLENKGEKVFSSDMVWNRDIGKNNRSRVIKRKLEEFSSSKIVITDRLHGMIFAILTNTPCIVFSNSNHKIEGVYQWVKELKHIKFINDINQFEESFDFISNVSVSNFESLNMKDLFDPLIQIMKDNI